jgi:hypothetical protein
MDTKTTLLIGIIILLVVILLQEELDTSRKSEQLTTFGGALAKQVTKEDILLPEQTEPAEKVRNELDIRMECMTSPARNTDSPLEFALHGHSATNQL